MCTLLKNKKGNLIQTNRKYGYKVLGWSGSNKPSSSINFFSTFTGQKIPKCGTVPPAPKYTMSLSDRWNSSADVKSLHKIPIHTTTLQKSVMFQQDFAGKTSAFIDINDAKKLYEDIKTNWKPELTLVKPVLVKIKFTGKIYIGYYYLIGKPCKIIASDKIVDIKIIY